MQSSKLRLELVETYVLRGHASLVPPLQKDPGGHASQLIRFVAVWYLPAVQLTHDINSRN